MIIAIFGDDGAGKTTIAMNMAIVIKDSLFVELGSKKSDINRYLTNGKLSVGWSDLKLKNFKSDLQEFKKNGDIPFIPGPSDINKNDIKKLLEVYSTSKYNNIIFDVENGLEKEFLNSLSSLNDKLIIKIHDCMYTKNQKNHYNYPIDILICNKYIKGIDTYYLEKEYETKKIWEVPFSTKIANLSYKEEFHYSKYVIKEIETMCLSEGLCENSNNFFEKIKAFVPKGRKS